jgi:hypothetical protein
MPEANATNPELANVSPGPPTDPAPVMLLHAELGRMLPLLDLALLGQSDPPLPYALNGMPISFKRRLPSASVFAVVTMLISKPRTLSTLSYSISGKISCSFNPNV